ncbi:MAG TPA: MFS transporter, partial [Terriglobales bacterium]|nr:MFS transporter [Terriglobales bacterium]
MSLRPGEDSAATGHRWTEERTDWLGVCFGLALSCFVAFQQFKLPPVLPELLQQFHYPRALAASFMSVYALVGLLGSVPLGRWLKRRSYGPGLWLGICSTALGLIVALAFARFGTALLLARALEGLTYAIFAIAGPVIATSSARFRDLPLVTGLLAGWIPIGQIGAGLLTLAVPQAHPLSQMLGLADWQVTWLVALVLTLLLGWFCWRFSHHQDVSSVNSRAKARETVTANTESAKSDGTSASLASAAVSRPAPQLTAALTKSQDGRWPDLLAAGIFLLWSAQYFAFMTWLTQYLIEQHNLQPQQAVLVYLLPVVVLLGFNLLTGWALGRGLALWPALIVSLVLQGLVWAATPFLGDVTGVIALLVYGVCSGIIPTCLFHLPHHIAAHRHRRRNGHDATTKAAVKAGPEGFATLMTGRNIG